MCTRFYIERNNPLLLPIIHDAEKSILIRKFADLRSISSAPESIGKGSCDRAFAGDSPLISSGEVRPTDIVPVLAPDPRGNRAVYPMKWGYRLNAKTVLFNARTETAWNKPLFRQDWALHRCIIPASWYYEWDHLTKDKYAIQPADQPVTWLCGLYHIENGLPHFVVLTRQPGKGLQKIHDRMPLIIPSDHIDDWIRPDTDPEELLSFTITDALPRKADPT